MFGDPFLVVLDEPNANLDADGENALGRAIKILRHNKSIVIVISHRPNALAALDMAMVLYEGKAIAFGTAQEMFARVGGSAAPPVAAGDAGCEARRRVVAVPWRAPSHDSRTTGRRSSTEPRAGSMSPRYDGIRARKAQR